MVTIVTSMLSRGFSILFVALSIINLHKCYYILVGFDPNPIPFSVPTVINISGIKLLSLSQIRVILSPKLSRAFYYLSEMFLTTSFWYFLYKTNTWTSATLPIMYVSSQNRLFF